MPTTIKVSDETKQLLDMIIQLALKHEDELLQAEKLPPLEKDPVMKPPIDWGIETDASKVDEYIYAED